MRKPQGEIPPSAPVRLQSRFRRRRRLRGIAQVIYLAGAVILGLGLPSVEIGADVPTVRATQLLFAVGGGVLAFIGVVYSILFLVVQFSTTTFTARLNLFRDSPIIVHSFGLYTAMAVFSLTAAFVAGDDENVSAILPIAVIVMLVAALLLFRAIQNAAFRSLQLAAILQQVLERGLGAFQALYGAGAAGALEHGVKGFPSRDLEFDRPANPVRWPYRTAVLQVIDLPQLFRLAQEQDATVELRCLTGDTLFQGEVVAVAHGARTDLAAKVLNALEAGEERTFEQDLRLAFRVLSDISLRALSAAVNDPTTASQTLDATEAMLRFLVTQDLDIGNLTSADGNLRLVIPLPTWEDYLGLAVDEVIVAGRSSPQARARTERLLQALLRLAPAGRQASIQAKLRDCAAAGVEV